MAVTQKFSVTEVSVDASANTSLVRILWQSTQTGESWNGYNRLAKIFISFNGGEEGSILVPYTLPMNSTKTIVDTTVPAPHNGDGTGTIRVRFWMDTGISAGVIEKTETLTLTTIPREAAITSALDRTLGETCSVTWTTLSKNHTYKLNFSIGSWSHTTGVIRPNSTTSFTYTGYTLPLEVANQLPNATQGTMKVILATYSDNDGKVQIGSDISANFTITVPNNASTQPAVSMSLAPSNALPSPYNSMYIQGLGKVKANLGFDTKYGATVADSNITVNEITYPSPYESDILSQSGKVTIKATVKDSRGFYGTIYKDIEVIPYSRPLVKAKSGESSIIAARCDSSANLDDSGTYLKIKAKAVFSKVISGGVQNNYGKIKFRYRIEGGSYSDWQTILDCKKNNSDEVITDKLLNGALNITSNYQVQIIVSDDFYDSDPITIAIASDAVYMDRPPYGKSMGLGGYSSGDGKLDVYWKTMARGGLSLIDAKGDEIPLGSTMPLPRDQVKGTWDADNLECGIYVVTDSSPLKSGETVIMYNGVLIQMKGTVGDHVKFQLTLPVDGNRSPMYRVNWYSNWSDWRSMKL